MLELVQPWTYRSPSGEVELFVDPTEIHGCGPAMCRMSKDGEQVWARTVPYTILDAFVLDDGTLAGFAYSNGFHWSGELIVAVFDPDGSERWVERRPRALRMPCSPPGPIVRELRPCEGGFEVGLDLGFRESEWWTFRWSPGGVLEQHRVQPSASSPIIESPILPSLELPMLGRVEFPWPVLPQAGSDPRSQAERRAHLAHRVFVDALGRVWISEMSPRVVHGFDSNGLPLFDLTPEPKTFRPFRMVEWIGLRGDGHLFVCHDRAIEEFEPSGERAKRTVVRDDMPRWLFQPGRSERWAVHGSGGIELFGPDGKLQRPLERGANGRWFQGFFEAAVAPDGGLAVLDEPNPWIPSRDPSTWVHLFSPAGEPRRSLRVPDEFTMGHLAFDGRRIALARDRALLLLNEDGSPIGRMVLPVELGEPYYLFFSPDGRELWVFPHMRHEMFRFALP